MHILLYGGIILAIGFIVSNLEYLHKKTSKNEIKSFIENSINTNVEKVYSGKMEKQFNNKLNEIDLKVDQRLDKKLSTIGREEIIEKIYSGKMEKQFNNKLDEIDLKMDQRLDKKLSTISKEEIIEKVADKIKKDIKLEE